MPDEVPMTAIKWQELYQKPVDCITARYNQRKIIDPIQKLEQAIERKRLQDKQIVTVFGTDLEL